jgi:hypothetical protein
VTGEEIRTHLDRLESKTVDLAEDLISMIATIRVRLVLLEAISEYAEIASRTSPTPYGHD